jgi:hypothetical protein
MLTTKILPWKRVTMIMVSNHLCHPKMNLVAHILDPARRSDRLKALAADKPSQATLGGTTSIRRRKRSGAGSKAATSPKKIVPYQEVEKWVFIQQVRIKIIKVESTLFFDSQQHKLNHIVRSRK